MTPKEQYSELFPTAELKATAFDRLAEKYYFGNFGSLSKGDLDVLMFSLYLDRLLEKNQGNYAAYSDYTLSKLLGITQSRISGLKVKKELQYPYADFKWQESFLTIAENAVYEDNKIKLFVPDKNLYLEIKNAIEICGGYVEVQLTPSLLQIRLPFFLDLIVAVSNEEEKETVYKQIREIIEKNSDVKLPGDKLPFGKALKEQTPEMIADIIGAGISLIPGIPGRLLEVIYGKIREVYKESKLI